ncbi:MAG: hypothetical protein ACLFVC_00525 [Opitutales bacterium]
MKGKYRIFPDASLIVFTVEGRLTLEGMRTLFRGFSTDHAYSLRYDGIADLRRIEEDLTREETKQLASEVVEMRLSEGTWVALVDRARTTALTQVYSRVVSPQHPLETCVTVERASQLLGRDVSAYVEA